MRLAGHLGNDPRRGGNRGQQRSGAGHQPRRAWGGWGPRSCRSGDPASRAADGRGAERVEVEGPVPPDDGRDDTGPSAATDTPRSSSASSTPASANTRTFWPGSSRPAAAWAEEARSPASASMPSRRSRSSRSAVVGAELLVAKTTRAPWARTAADGAGRVTDGLTRQPDHAVQVDDPQPGLGEAQAGGEADGRPALIPSSAGDPRRRRARRRVAAAS